MPVTPTTSDVVFWVVCGVLALVVITKAWPFIRRAVTTGDAIGGLPELAEQVGLLATTVEEIAAQVETIHHEVTPNDGGSIKDSVKRIEATLDDVKERQNAGAQLIAGVTERQNDTEKAIVRLHERIDVNHPPRED